MLFHRFESLILKVQPRRLFCFSIFEVRLQLLNADELVFYFGWRS